MTGHMRFDGKVAVVTGAGSGVGRAYARELGRRGAHVLVNDLGGTVDGRGGSGASAARVAEEIQAAGGEAAPNFDSVATIDGGARIVAAAIERFGGCDVLIANAGILRDSSFAKLSAEDLEAVLDVHLIGSFSTAQPAFRHMKETRGGKIILTSSASGLFGSFGQANYAAAKMGAWGLARTLSIEGERYGIDVNCVAPAASTRMSGGEEGSGPRAPSSVAALVVALCHESCDISGETFMAGYNWYTRCFMSQARGWVAGEEVEVSAEDVVDSWSQILDPQDAREVARMANALDQLEEQRPGATKP